MGRSAPVPPPPPPFNPLEPLKDAFLYSGDFKWMFYVSLAGFCAANGAAVLTATPKINYFHGCALMVLMCFGGSTMAAIMCGKPVAFVCNEALVPVCLSVWTVMYLLPDVTINFFKKNKVGILFTSAMYEMMRCHVLMNCTAMAAGTLGSVLAVPSAGRVPIIGPLIAGTLGGCGGGFMPFDKGLGATRHNAEYTPARLERKTDPHAPCLLCRPAGEGLQLANWIGCDWLRVDAAQHQLPHRERRMGPLRRRRLFCSGANGVGAVARLLPARRQPAGGQEVGGSGQEDEVSRRETTLASPRHADTAASPVLGRPPFMTSREGVASESCPYLKLLLIYHPVDRGH